MAGHPRARTSYATRCFTAIVTLAAASLSIAPAAASPTASGDAGERGRVHVVDRTVIFSATETSTTRIRFSRPIAWSEVSHVHVTGQGRIYGFMLRKAGHYVQESDRPFVKWITSAMCTQRGCRTRDSAHPGLDSAVHSGDLSVLSGVWDVYVIADGAPVRAEIRIKGSRGRDQIPAVDPARSEMRNLPVVMHEEAGHSVYVAGDYSRLKAPDFAQVAVIINNDPYLASTGGVCGLEIDEDDAGPREVAFFPGCPQAGTTGTVGLAYMTHVAPGGRRNILRTGAFVEGERGIGGWYATASVVEEFGVVGFWIDFP